MKLSVLLALAASLFGCSAAKKPQIDDGPGMEYKDSDYRTVYANVLDFDSYEGQPYFAVAFLGYGDIMDQRNSYVNELFKTLDTSAIDKIDHVNYEGDEWYLVVPRYRESVDIRNLDTNQVHTIYQGEAFTVRCNLSDLHSNIEISTAQGLSGHIFSPMLDGQGKLVSNPDIYDITDDIFMEE